MGLSVAQLLIMYYVQYKYNYNFFFLDIYVCIMLQNAKVVSILIYAGYNIRSTI